MSVCYGLVNEVGRSWGEEGGKMKGTKLVTSRRPVSVAYILPSQGQGSFSRAFEGPAKLTKIQVLILAND